MRRFVVGLVAAGLIAAGILTVVFLRSGFSEVVAIRIDYPPDGAVFPPEIVAPAFRWEDLATGCNAWLISLQFPDNRDPIRVQVDTCNWTPPEAEWQEIKSRSRERESRFTVSGISTNNPTRILSEGTITIGVSRDKVGAPIFYREVNLPFIDAVKDPSRIRWRLGEVSCKGRPPVVLENLPVCGNCHSFSANGAWLGMDVDYANDRGAYALTQIEEDTVLDTTKIITWSDYRRNDKKPTFGLLSQVSPDGNYVISTVKDRSVFVPRPDLAFSQLFFPIKGILVVYSRRTKTFSALPGADDPQYVQSNPTWSPDGKYIVFARSKVYRLMVKNSGDTLLTEEECKDFLKNGKSFQFDLYRIPFNDGKGGRAEPLAGASGDGMSNYFPKYSPDGKWIVFCKAKSFMLLQRDSRLHIIPAEGGASRLLNCNMDRMNSWHSWSPNSKWLIFTSKANSAYTQLFLTHIDENGGSSPPIVLSQFTSPDRAANIPEFVNMKTVSLKKLTQRFLDDQSYVRAAGQFIFGGDEKRAEEACHKALAINAGNSSAYCYLGKLAMNRGDLVKCEHYLSKAIALKPIQALPYSTMGDLLCLQKRFPEAEAQYRMAIQVDPEFMPARRQLGTILKLLGAVQEAESQLRKAIDLDPDESASHYNLAQLLFKQNRLEEAASHYREVVRIDAGNSSAILNLGLALYVMGKTTEGISLMSEALRLKPDAKRYVILYRALAAQSRIAEAADCLRSMLRMQPEDLMAMRELAWILATARDPKVRNGAEAVGLAERAAQLAGGPQPEILDTVAAAYAEAGRFSEAVRAAEQAHALACEQKKDSLSEAIRARIDSYRAGSAFRDTATGSTAFPSGG